MSKNKRAQQGAVAEYKFFAEATARGLAISAPILNYSPYDAVVDTGKRFLKVQIKSAAKEVRKGTVSYSFNIQHSDGVKAMKRYSATDVTHFAFYAANEGAWYIVPFKVVAALKRVRITLGRANRLDKYKNAWNVLR